MRWHVNPSRSHEACLGELHQFDDGAGLLAKFEHCFTLAQGLSLPEKAGTDAA